MVRCFFRFVKMFRAAASSAGPSRLSYLFLAVSTFGLSTSNRGYTSWINFAVSELTLRGQRQVIPGVTPEDNPPTCCYPLDCDPVCWCEARLDVWSFPARLWPSSSRSRAGRHLCLPLPSAASSSQSGRCRSACNAACETRLEPEAVRGEMHQLSSLSGASCTWSVWR